MKLKPTFKAPRSKKPAGDTAAPARKAHGYKGISGARFILFIGDEGAILIYFKKHAVRQRQFVSDASEPNLQILRETLNMDKKAPLLIVIDSMDQSYVQQSLPPVSALSIHKLIKRRLERDFGNYEIKGAIVLGRDTSQRKDWNFLMVAVDKGPQLSLWLEFVAGLPNRLQGIYLVAAEAEAMVKRLEKAMGVPKEGGAEWKFLVSHNKVGGVRQVILRNGRLIFTRMTQPLIDSSPEILAGNIEQDMLNTIEYIRRLSFTSKAGLDIYIIASSAIKASLDPAKFNASSVHMLTPYEVAQYLGIEGATQPSDQFGDVVLAASIGQSRRHILPLSTRQSQYLNKFYRGMVYQRVAACLIAAGIFAYTCGIFYDIYNFYEKKTALEQSKGERQKSLDDLRGQIAQSHIEVEKSSDLIDLYQQLQKEKLTPLPFLAALRTVIKPPILVKALDWSLDNVKPDQPFPTPARMTAVLTLEFPGVTTGDSFKRISDTVLANLKAALSGYDIAYSKLPTRFSDSEAVDMVFSENNVPDAPKDTDASPDVQLTIKGSAVVAAPAPAEGN